MSFPLMLKVNSPVATSMTHVITIPGSDSAGVWGGVNNNCWLMSPPLTIKQFDRLMLHKLKNLNAFVKLT